MNDYNERNSFYESQSKPSRTISATVMSVRDQWLKRSWPFWLSVVVLFL